MKTLAGIGGVAVVGIIVTLFFSFGRRPSDIADPLQPAGGVSGLHARPGRGGRGPAARRRHRAPAEQRRPVLPRAATRRSRGRSRASTSRSTSGRTGKASDELLRHPHRAGPGRACRCASSSTGMGGLHAPDEDIERLEAAGGKVKVFRAARLGQARRASTSATTGGPSSSTAASPSPGGMAVGDKWLGNARNEKEWRDSMVQVTGPLAATVQSAFVDNWAHVADDDETGGEILVGPAFFPEFPAPGAGAGREHRPPHRARQLALQREPPDAAASSCRRSPPRARSSTSPTPTSCPTRPSARR